MEQGRSKPLCFPTYRQSHFRSQTYLTLVRIFSHLPVMPDNGCGGIEHEISKNGPKFFELVGSASMDPKDPIPKKTRKEVHETTEGDGDKGQDEKQDNSNEVELMNYQVDGRLLDSALQKDKFEMQNEETKGEMEKGELAPNFSSIVIKRGNLEDGELIEDFVVDGECDSMLKSGNRKDDNKDHGNSSASKVDVISKQKRSLGSEERKAKRKEKKRKNREEKNKQLGVKRLKLPLIQKSKTISYCRHYLVGRCHEGEKCKFSHDTMPLMKSTPCRHFARRSCMKGDDCPFDHELSKYPCNNFVTKGFCRRGDACLFSHQIPTKEDSPTSLKVCRPELESPFLPGNTSLSVPPNTYGNFVQKNHLNNSIRIHPVSNSENKVTSTIKQQLTPPPNGIRFINIGKPSLPSRSTPEKGLTTPKKECFVHIGVCFDESAFGTKQNLVEIPKKLPTMELKGVNILCFGKDSVYSFESSFCSTSNKEAGIKVPKFVNFGLHNNTSSSLRGDDCSKSMNGTNHSVPRMDLVSKGIQSSFLGKAWTCDTITDLRGSTYSHAYHNQSKSAQEAKEAKEAFGNSQTLTATSCMLSISQFGLQQSSKFLPFRNHENAWNLGQRSFLSILAFATNESSIR